MEYEDDQIERTSVTISITVDWTLNPPDWSETEKEIKMRYLAPMALALDQSTKKSDRDNSKLAFLDFKTLATP